MATTKKTLSTATVAGTTTATTTLTDSQQDLVDLISPYYPAVDFVAGGQNIISDLKSIPYKQIDCIDALLHIAFSTTLAELREIYDEYFSKGMYSVISELDVILCNLNKPGNEDNNLSLYPGCPPPVCTKLNGTRDGFKWIPMNMERLFSGDFLYLFYLDKMGLFPIVTKLVDDYAEKGTFSISNTSFATVVLEIWTEKLKASSASMLRDREATYKRTLGWTLGLNGLNVEAQINSSWTNQFHKFIHSALDYYKQYTLTEVVQGGTAKFRSTSSQVELKETLRLLKDSLSPFYYGRNYLNAIKGIVYAISGIGLIYDLSDDIGISSSYTKLSEIIPAAYTKVVDGSSGISTKLNRYITHMSCGTAGRAIMNLIEIIDLDTIDIKEWLLNEQIEEYIQTYAKNYFDITGVRLADSIDNIPQQAMS